MRDATDYYNLFRDTLKYGRNQIQHIYSKIGQAVEKGKYVNIRTGYLIKEKDCNDYNYYFNDDTEYPLCYYFSCCGLARERVIKKILDFYVICLREYDRTKDDEKMKELIDNEINSAKQNYENLNKNNKGNDDLKLFNIPPHLNEPKETENSVNSSSFINDNSSSSCNENNSFIDDNEINEDNKENEDNSEEKHKNKKAKLVKNGKNVVNKYKQELDDLLEDNYDGEDDLINEGNDEDIDLDLETKGSSLKKKKLCKTKLLNRKTKRNVVNDSDEEKEEEEKPEKEIEQNNYNDNENNLEKEIKNLIKKDEENEEESDIKNKKKKEAITEEYYKDQKEKLRLKQGNLDAFLNITH